MKKKRRKPAGRTQRARQIDKKGRSNSGSAYWESLPDSVDGVKIEPFDANPDLLIDYSDLYKEEREEMAERLDAIKRAMSKVLSPKEFNAMQLLCQGFTYDKIALNMGIRLSTVQVYLERARQKLKPYLNIDTVS